MTGFDSINFSHAMKGTETGHKAQIIAALIVTNSTNQKMAIIVPHLDDK